MNSNPIPPEKRLELAEFLEERGRYNEALDEWRELASERPDAAVLCRLGRLAEQLGYIDEAEQAFRRAIQVDDKMPLAHGGLGSILLDRGQFAAAMPLIQEALAHEKNPIFYTMLGVALMSLERIREASENFEAAIRLDPSYEEAYFNLGLIKQKMDPRAAEVLFLKALEADPDYADAHRELGWLMDDTERSAEAEYHLRRSLELKPQDPWTKIYLGNRLWKSRDVSAAIPLFEEAIVLMPGKALPIWSLANVYESLELWEKAEELYERAIETGPADPAAHMQLSRLLVKRQDLARAEVHARLALSLDPSYEAAGKLLAEIEKKSGHPASPQ